MIDSSKNDTNALRLKSDQVLAKVASDFIKLDFEVETGKKASEKIRVPVLFGHQGKVKSPTYTLVEPYELATANVYHFDLYRLGDPEELEFIGIRDYLSQGGCCLVEWPERGAGMLPLPDLQITITAVEDGRRLSITCNTPKGETVLASLPEPG